MKTTPIQLACLLICFSMFFYSCEVSDLESRTSYLNLPNVPFDYGIGVNNELPTLGRVLFYDSRLSANNVVSCASCHKQQLAFSDDKQFSFGFNGELTKRNSMPIQNIVSTTFPVGVEVDSTGSFKSTSLFWDGRQHDVTAMVLEPIQNHIEMGVSNLDDLMNKIESIADYKPLFKSAFGSESINKDKVALALSSFIVSIRSTASSFDLALAGMGNLSDQAQIGQDLFFNTYNCNSCHQLQKAINGYQSGAPDTTTSGDPSLLSAGFTDIGLDKIPSDEGAFRITGVPSDKGKFKIASLRNVALTAPYMHDGRFKTLSEVIDHYSSDIEDSENLDARFRDTNGAPKKFNISSIDKYAIITFLNSMTDHSLISDSRFSNPFTVR
jgi:cytochrome c peroxidase